MHRPALACMETAGRAASHCNKVGGAFLACTHVVKKFTDKLALTNSLVSIPKVFTSKLALTNSLVSIPKVFTSTVS